MRRDPIEPVAWSNCILAVSVAFCVLFATAPGASGQGEVIFNNRVLNVVVAPIFGPEPGDPEIVLHGNPTNGFPSGSQIYLGTALAGSGYTAQLWGGPADTSETHLSLAVNGTTVFRTGAAAGFVVAPWPNPAIPGVASGLIATLQLRAWDNRGGTITNWAQVLADPTILRGASLPFLSLPLGGVLVTAPTLIGVTSFNLHTDNPAETPPSINVQPQSQTVLAGAPVTFSVLAHGTFPLFFQWRLDGDDLPGATATTLSLTNTTDSDAGLYSVIVSNAYGTAISSNARLSVISGPPILTLQPTNQTVQQGTTVTFVAAATGSFPLRFQWMFDGADVPGATNAALRLDNVANSVAGMYSVRVSNALGTATSTNALLTVLLSPGGSIVFNNRVAHTVIAPIFSPEPDNPALVKHGNPTNGFPAGTQVYYGRPLEGTNFTAQLWAGVLGSPESKLLPVPGALTAFRTGLAAGFISAVVPNPQVLGVPGSARATLQMRAWDNRRGTVTNWEGVLADPTVARGSSTLFDSLPLGDILNPSPNLDGLTAFSLYIPAPLILCEPTNQVVLAGSDVTFTAGASGTPPLSYQWTFNDGDIAAGEVQIFTLTNAQWWHQGNYALRVSNAYGEVTSAPASLVVLTPAKLSNIESDGGTTRFILEGNPWLHYQVETSTNLVHWVPIASVRPSRSGMEVTDSNAVGSISRFYRAMLTP